MKKYIYVILIIFSIQLEYNHEILTFIWFGTVYFNCKLFIRYVNSIISSDIPQSPNLKYFSLNKRG